MYVYISIKTYLSYMLTHTKYISTFTYICFISICVHIFKHAQYIGMYFACVDINYEYYI